MSPHLNAVLSLKIKEISVPFPFTSQTVGHLIRPMQGAIF